MILEAIRQIGTARPDYVRGFDVSEFEGERCFSVSLLDSHLEIIEGESCVVWHQVNGEAFLSEFSKENLVLFLKNIERNVVMVAAHYEEDLSWLKYIPLRYVTLSKTKGVYGTAPFAPRELPNLNKGNEASAYLAFIIENYDVLPNHTLFVHAHETSWHEDIPKIKMVETLNLCDYQNVNARHRMYQTLSPKVNSIPYGYIQKAWPHLFDCPTPQKLSFYSCAQFVVSKARILSRPKAFYERCLKWLYETDMPTFHSSRVFEYIWHYIFTGLEVEPKC